LVGSHIGKDCITLPNLNDIGKKYGTDKANGFHGYLDEYERIANLPDLRDKEMKMLEIGVLDGASIKMWAEYFEKGRIVGVDNLKRNIHLGNDNVPSNFVVRKDNALYGLGIEALLSLYSDIMDDNSRVELYNYDQGKRDHLEMLINDAGGDFDFIIDDGSHFQEDQMVSFSYLLQHLKSGGYYIIEDVALPLSGYFDEFNPADVCWGIEKTSRQTGFFRDIVFNTFIDFAATGTIKSKYLTDEEMEYINNNVATSERFNGLDIQVVCLSARSSFITIRKK